MSEYNINNSETRQLKILFSKPVTFRSSAPLPEDFELLADEASLSWGFGTKYPTRISELVVRLYLLMALLRRRKDVDVVVTGRYGELFALFQGVFPRGRKVHILLDSEWPNRHYNRLRELLSILIHRGIARGVHKMQVFCRIEADNYASYFGIDRDKFVWIPYCTDLGDLALQTEEQDYLFTGGLHHRDYETLFYAVKDLPIDVYVAAPEHEIDKRLVSQNMRLLGISNHDEYFSTMARAKLVVLSLEPGIMRCPGVITYVTAMRMGKCVIVNETQGTQDYIIDGRTGVVVRERDPEALKNAITSLLSDAALRRQISGSAFAFAAEHFSISRYISDLNKLLREVQ